MEEAGRGPVPYLYIQVFARRGRCVGIGADGGAGVDVISAEVVYGVADPTADGAAVIPAAKTNTSRASEPHAVPAHADGTDRYVLSLEAPCVIKSQTKIFCL